MTDWLRTGLSRLPPSSQDAAERLAGLCHTGGLPTLERAMRRLHGELQRYFGRSAAFRPELLLRRMGDAWRLAGALQTAEGLRVLELAGVFREEYLPVGDLRLYLLGLQEVDLASGYAGTVYYFWETQQQRYYTYRDLRPKFYDARRQPGPAETILWALPGPCARCGTAVWTSTTPGPRGCGSPLLHGPVPRDPAEKKPAGRDHSGGSGHGGLLPPAPQQPDRTPRAGAAGHSASRPLGGAGV